VTRLCATGGEETLVGPDNSALHLRSNNEETATSKQCDAGSYRRGNGCTVCPTGTWSSCGSKSCNACPAGQFTKDHLSCVDCPAGEYSQQKSGACLKCGIGKVSKQKSKSCTSCQAGSYADHVLNICAKCPIGQYSKAKASVCASCPSRLKVNALQTGCIRTSSPPTSPPTSPPSTPPIPYPWKCPAGQYPYYYTSDISYSSTNFRCHLCSEGVSYWPAGAYSCTGCQATYRLTEAKNGCEEAGPLKCKPGYYGKDYDKCPAGTYRNNDSYMISCQSCPVGSAPNADQSNCVEDTPTPSTPPTSPPSGLDRLCKSGEYPFYYAGKYTCTQCGYNTYWPAGAYSCSGCPLMYRVNEAKNGCEEAGPLKCKPGYYGKYSNGVYGPYPCDKCPTGTYRNNDSYMLGCQSCPVGSAPNADQSNCVEDTPTPSTPPTSPPSGLDRLCKSGEYPLYYAGKYTCTQCGYNTRAPDVL
jgi:hypothetical protein